MIKAHLTSEEMEILSKLLMMEVETERPVFIGVLYRECSIEKDSFKAALTHLEGLQLIEIDDLDCSTTFYVDEDCV